MNYLYFNDNVLNINDNLFSIDGSYTDGPDNANIHLINDDNDFWILFQSNDVTINGVLQTSAQMIIDTLSNGQS